LGVNATRDPEDRLEVVYDSFQWAPTLGGECYYEFRERVEVSGRFVSMGTHPWG